MSIERVGSGNFWLEKYFWRKLVNLEIKEFVFLGRMC